MLDHDVTAAYADWVWHFQPAVTARLKIDSEVLDLVGHALPFNVPANYRSSHLNLLLLAGFSHSLPDPI
jgi:hypothetical protein